MPSRFATPDWLVLSAGRYVKAMPSLADQYTRMQGFIVIFTVLRLLTPLKMYYEAPKKRASRIPRSWKSYRRAPRDGAVGATGCQQRPSRVRAGQYSLGWECAIARAGILRGASRQRMFSLSELRFRILKT